MHVILGICQPRPWSYNRDIDLLRVIVLDPLTVYLWTTSNRLDPKSITFTEVNLDRGGRHASRISRLGVFWTQFGVQIAQ